MTTRPNENASHRRTPGDLHRVISDANAPIGIFDSGVGGLTVFRAIEKRLPNESLVYLGDTARIPYGTRSSETVQRYALEDAAFIMSRSVKSIVIACNTASALAASRLREECHVPVLGVIRAGARRAVSATRSGRIGVIGTEATVNSGAYKRAIKALRMDVEISSRACPLFVPLVEEGWLDHEVTHRIAEEYLADFRQSEIDTLVLGCTHYPILRPVIESVIGAGVSFIDSGEAVAEALAQLLEENSLLRPSANGRFEEFYVTDGPLRFSRVAERFLDRRLDAVQSVELGTS